jgi:hypothetical protein
MQFEFYNTVTVTLEVYIQTHCHDHHICFNPDPLGGNGTPVGLFIQHA